MKPTILLVDDEKALTAELAPFLERSDFKVAVARDGEEALALVETAKPDLIVLDVVMPRLNGREVCRQLRSRGDWTPVIMLTQIGAAVERGMTLEEGADDYLNKPFDPFELVARIRAVLRRTGARVRPIASARRLVSGALVVDRTSRRAFLGERELMLTTKAIAALEYLMLHHGEVIRRARMLEEVWGWDYPGATRAVDVRVAEVRRALGDDAGEGRFIETVVGEGYRFTAPVVVEA
ncbi:MAG: response regulator transcription factor [Chloroflexi bacterium]|nr:response regulator transcription factor [Chloroflexota bacterium]